MTLSNRYPRLTVDPLVLCVSDGRLCVAVYKRDDEPFKAMLAIPGGHSYVNETTVAALKRALETKTVIKFQDLSYVEQLYFFDANVDPRGHAVSLSYLCLIRQKQVEQYAKYLLPVDALPKLAYDHNTIVKKAVNSLKQQLLTTTIAGYMLNEKFSLNDLYRLYQAVFNKEFDNRNFRKKFLDFDVLADTGKREEGVPYRPSKLYKFKSKAIQNLDELKF